MVPESALRRGPQPGRRLRGRARRIAGAPRRDLDRPHRSVRHASTSSSSSSLAAYEEQRAADLLGALAVALELLGLGLARWSGRTRSAGRSAGSPTVTVVLAFLARGEPLVLGEAGDRGAALVGVVVAGLAVARSRWCSRASGGGEPRAMRSRRFTGGGAYAAAGSPERPRVPPALAQLRVHGLAARSSPRSGSCCSTAEWRRRAARRRASRARPGSPAAPRQIEPAM